MTNNNFKWLMNDIDKTLVLKVIYKRNDREEEYGIFNVFDVLETTGEELDVKTANIDDLTSLLTLGIVRFVNILDSSDVLDIPFRNLYLLYQNANVLGEDVSSRVMSLEDLDIFSVIDGTVRNEFLVVSAAINEPSAELDEVMKIAHEFGSYSMQEKFNALSKITVINHRRLVAEQKEKVLK